VSLDDTLEVIDLDEHHADLDAKALRHRQFFAAQLVKVLATGQTGDSV
jgi:hypothetical protein